MTKKRYDENILQNRPIGELNAEAFEARMNALFEHYSIERTHPLGLEWLAICLAMDHVPGFQPQSRPGAPRKRNASDRVFVIMDFCRIQKEEPKGTSDSSIFDKMSEDQHWIDQGLDKDALRNIYYQSRKPRIASEMLSELENMLALVEAKKLPKDQL